MGLIARIKNRFSRPLTSFEVYKNHIDIDKSSFVFGNINFGSVIESRKYLRIGAKCIINGDFSFESGKGSIVIGNNVHLGGVKLICISKIEIEDDVSMAWGITLYDHNSHSIYWEERKNDSPTCYDDYVKYKNNIKNKNWSVVKTESIKVCSKAWIGFDAVILKGVTIGEGAVVGARSVVTSDVEPWTVVGGNPAKFLKKIR